MKRIAILIVLLVIVRFLVSGQTQKTEIVTDRPDQTESSFLIPQGSLQVETGFFFEQKKEQQVQVNNFAFNTTLFKYGVNENFELRFITEYLGEFVKNPEAPAIHTKGFSPIALGAKIKLADQKWLWPQAALIGHINLKTGSKEFMPTYASADFRFTFSHTLSDQWSLSYNLGAAWNGESPEAVFLYTLSFGYSINNKLAAFAESYSFFPEAGKGDNRIDGGFTYKFTPVLQFDISGGVGLSKNAPDYFLSFGSSFRLFK